MSTANEDQNVSDADASNEGEGRSENEGEGEGDSEGWRRGRQPCTKPLHMQRRHSSTNLLRQLTKAV